MPTKSMRTYVQELIRRRGGRIRGGRPEMKAETEPMRSSKARADRQPTEDPTDYRQAR